MTNTVRATQLAVLTAGILMSIGAWGQSTAAGLWKSIDDTSGKPSALIRIAEQGGEFKGRIEKLFPAPAEDPNPKCVKCVGEGKDQPIIGMVIVKGMRADGKTYTGGTILDPDNGEVYRSKMTLADDGKKLNVRGYVGIPLIGRTQVWLREE